MKIRSALFLELFAKTKLNFKKKYLILGTADVIVIIPTNQDIESLSMISDTRFQFLNCRRTMGIMENYDVQFRLFAYFKYIHEHLILRVLAPCFPLCEYTIYTYKTRSIRSPDSSGTSVWFVLEYDVCNTEYRYIMRVEELEDRK